MASNRKSKKNRIQEIIEHYPDKVAEDIEFLLRESYKIEHEQDLDGIRKLRKEYGIVAPWE